MSLRNVVSPETLQRAIKARLALSEGVASRCILMTVPVEKMPVEADGLNWKLDTSPIPPDCVESFESAAAVVGRSLNLN